MKKIFATLLAFVYLSSSLGATLHFHYCMGKLVALSLDDQTGKNCSYCGMSKKTADHSVQTLASGCCRDAFAQIKTDKDQKQVTAELLIYKNFTQTAIIENFSQDILPATRFIGNTHIHAPPPASDLQSKYIRFRNLRL